MYKSQTTTLQTGTIYNLLWKKSLCHEINKKGSEISWWPWGKETSIYLKNTYPSSSIISRNTDMSRLDKMMYFIIGLWIEIQEEVKMQRFQNTTDAIAYALSYEKAHRISIYKNNKNMRNQNYDSKLSSSQSPQPNHQS